MELYTNENEIVLDNTGFRDNCHLSKTNPAIYRNEKKQYWCQFGGFLRIVLSFVSVVPIRKLLSAQLSQNTC